MEYRNRLARYIGRRRIFFKTLGLLTALSLMTVLIFGVFMNQLVVKNQKKNIDALNLHQLQRISSDVELVFRLLAQSMSRSMWSDDFIDLMITPDQHNADLAFRVIQALQDQVEENDLVRKAYLYLPYSDEVYVYSGTYTDLEYLGDRDLIYKYLDEREDDRDPESVSEWKILLYNRRIFLASDFCLPNFVGAMFYEINRSELYDIIQAENKQFDTTIYVYDEQGGPLFDYMAAGLQAEDFLQPELFMTDADEGSGSWYLYTSQTLGWRYLVRIDPGRNAVPFAALVTLLLPGFAFYILVSQLFSLYITDHVYRPINRLIQITTNPQKRKERSECRKTAQNEVDFLELAYLDSLDKNEQHRELMEHISDDILKQLFRTLLSGEDRESETILHTLEGIGRTDLAKGHYIALSAELSASEDKNATLIERELYQRSFLRLLEQVDAADYVRVALPMGLSRLAVVLCFDSETSVYQIRETLDELEQEIRRGVEPLPYHLQLGKGRICSDLTSLQFSYREAVESVQYLQYMSDGSEEEKKVESGRCAGSYEERYYVERAHHGYLMAEKGQLQEAKDEFCRMTDEISRREEDRERFFQNLIDDMFEKLIACRVPQEEISQAGISGSLAENRVPSGRNEAFAFMTAFYEKTLPLLFESSKKSHNRYVEDAKEYIAAHYADGALTLNTVSEAVGISASYLSGIFAEACEMGFNAWLNDFRIRQSKRFLNETGLNISEIGYKCGFNSAQSFTRVFKKLTGMTPKQYRELPREGQ